MIELLAFAFPGGLLGLLFKIAILCVIIWAVYALLQWLGVTIPRPVQIILIALGCILLIYVIFIAFQMVVGGA